MASQWVLDEMETADLRDKRLERRLVELLDTLSQASTASIPSACHDRAEMVAAYRFFDNDKVGFEEVLAQSRSVKNFAIASFSTSKHSTFATAKHGAAKASNIAPAKQIAMPVK